MTNEPLNNYLRASDAMRRGEGRRQRLGLTWRINCPVLRRLILSGKHWTQQLAEIDNGTYYSNNIVESASNAKRRELQLQWWGEYLHRYDIPGGVEESQYTCGAVVVPGFESHGAITPDHARLLAIAQRISSMGAQDRVLEIGGGKGALARVLKLRGHGTGCYVLIDLPESLYFAELFLRANFPTARITYAHGAICADDLCDGAIVLVPGHNVDAVSGIEFDLFVNTASFGEMHRSDVRHYVDLVEHRNSVRNLYVLNRFLNTINPVDYWGQHRLEENEASVAWGRKWRTENWILEPPHAQCPYWEPTVSRNLEWAATTEPSSLPQLRGMEHQDWAVMPEYFRHGNVTHPLSVRLHFSSELHTLWERVRLIGDQQERAESAALMVLYLAHLTDAWPFEEMAYYLEIAGTGRDSDLLTKARRVCRKLHARWWQLPQMLAWRTYPAYLRIQRAMAAWMLRPR